MQLVATEVLPTMTDIGIHSVTDSSYAMIVSSEMCPQMLLPTRAVSRTNCGMPCGSLNSYTSRPEQKRVRNRNLRRSTENNGQQYFLAVGTHHLPNTDVTLVDHHFSPESELVLAVYSNPVRYA